MANSRLERLRLPERAYDVEHLRPWVLDEVATAKKGRPVHSGFPTREALLAEDRKRLRLARRLLRERHPAINRKQVRALIATLKPNGAKGRMRYGSARAYKRLQVRVIGALLKLMAEQSQTEFRFFTLLKRAWIIPESELTVERVRSVVRSFRQLFQRADTRGLRGYLFARLDGAFDTGGKVWILHFHGICTGEIANFIDGVLRERAPFAGDDYIVYPVQIEPIREAVSAASYVNKHYWDCLFNNGLRGNERKRMPQGRVKEPYSTIYLSVLNQLPVGELYCVKNIDISDGYLVPKPQ